MSGINNLLTCIKHLGFRDGWRYYKINRCFQSRPKEYAEFLFEAKKRAILMRDYAMIEWIELCEKSLDEWNKARKIKP
jgi:hypothetical protein